MINGPTSDLCCSSRASVAMYELNPETFNLKS